MFSLSLCAQCWCPSLLFAFQSNRPHRPWRGLRAIHQRNIPLTVALGFPPLSRPSDIFSFHTALSSSFLLLRLDIPILTDTVLMTVVPIFITARTLFHLLSCSRVSVCSYNVVIKSMCSLPSQLSSHNHPSGSLCYTCHRLYLTINWIHEHQNCLLFSLSLSLNVFSRSLVSTRVLLNSQVSSQLCLFTVEPLGHSLPLAPCLQRLCLTQFRCRSPSFTREYIQTP